MSFDGQGMHVAWHSTGAENLPNVCERHGEFAFGNSAKFIEHLDANVAVVRQQRLNLICLGVIRGEQVEQDTGVQSATESPQTRQKLLAAWSLLDFQ